MPPAARSLPGLLRHWTPVAVGLVMSSLLYCQRSSEGFPLAATGASRTLLAAAFSNQFYAAYLPAVDHSCHNHSPTPKMPWPNVDGPAAGTRFFAQPPTNRIGAQP